METKKRLSKALAQAGVASRRHCEELIFAGKVTVNGKVVLLPQTLVSLQEDIVCVNGKTIDTEEKKVYFILNKPKGYICSNARVGNKKLVQDLFTSVPQRLFSVGRLDRETKGLLILTNDGHFANKVIHPSSNISKEYLVKTGSEISFEHIKIILEGLEIDGDFIRPLRVTKIRKGTLKVVVKEGKKREVRLLVQKAGLEVQELKRIRIGGLLLGDLKEGEFRELTDLDKKVIFS